MGASGLRCLRCGGDFGLDRFADCCPDCSPDIVSGLTVTYDDYAQPALSRERVAEGPRSIWRYAHSLPVGADQAISLGEGLTPMLRMAAIGAELGVPELYAKCEGANPTGSFKDRLASVAVSAAGALFGAPVIASSSTGNAGVSAAAYAARAGIPCIILTTAGVSGPMIAQMAAFGATILSLPDKQSRWDLLGEGVRRHGWYPTSPYFAPPTGSNPLGIEGYKSLAYEIAEDLGWTAPDWIVLPVCYGDALLGMWKGFRELVDLGWVSSIPRFAAAEIYGSIGAALKSQGDRVDAMEKTHETQANSISALQSTYQAVFVLRETEGVAVQVREGEFLDARERLARREGLFVETAAACSLSAAVRLRSDGVIEGGDTVVCLLTADGLKNTADAAQIAAMTIDAPPDFDRAMDKVVRRGGPELRRTQASAAAPIGGHR